MVTLMGQGVQKYISKTELREKYYFVISLLLFFPVLLDVLFENQIDKGEGILSWGAVIAIILISYVLFEMVDSCSILFNKILHSVLIFEVFTFAMQLLSMALLIHPNNFRVAYEYVYLITSGLVEGLTIFIFLLLFLKVIRVWGPLEKAINLLLNDIK